MVDTPHAAVRGAHPHRGHRGTGPLPAYAIGRLLPVPLVIFESVLGILAGPDLLGWAGDGQVIDTLSDLGLTMLISLAGYEIEFDKIRGVTNTRMLGLGIALAIPMDAMIVRSLLVPVAMKPTGRATWWARVRCEGSTTGSAWERLRLSAPKGGRGCINLRLRRGARPATTYPQTKRRWEPK
ncbi:cation:proton antiporter [Streptomyces prunicolor]|uniref:cation:proton antiporter domain-containing protein n=1 Tax=Streptomyces prunicolor TaxID=67348 RepID=UPI0037106A82